MSPLLEREGSLRSVKEDPNVSAFSLTLKPEQGAEPLWITLPVWGEAQWESLAHPSHGQAALAPALGDSRDGPSSAQTSPEPALQELLWARGSGDEDAQGMVGKEVLTAASGDSLDLVVFP